MIQIEIYDFSIKTVSNELQSLKTFSSVVDIEGGVVTILKEAQINKELSPIDLELKEF